MNQKGYGRGGHDLIESLSQHLPGGKTLNISAMIASVKAEIQTEHLNTSLEGYHRTSLLDNYKVRKGKII
jgi:hypothetical protein